MKNLKSILASCIIGSALAASSAMAATLETSPFISGSILNDVTFASSYPGSLYIEDGVVLDSGSSSAGWADRYYAQGYGVVTSIKLQAGGMFGDIDFMLSTGFFAGSYSHYQLLLSNVVIQSGDFGYINGYGTGSGDFQDTFFGFSGGGFDEIRIADSSVSGGSVGDGAYSAISLSSFRNAGASASVPDAGNTLALFGAALVGLAAFRAKRSA